MPIPISNTTITLLQAPDADEWGGAPDESSYVPVDGVQIPAVIGRPAGAASVTSDSSTVVYRYPLICNPCTITEDMMVRDNKTGIIYQVEEASLVNAPLIDHTAATLIKSVASY